MVKYVCVSVERLCQDFCCVARSLVRLSQRADSPPRTSTVASRMYKQGREALQVSPVAGSEGSSTTRKCRQEVVGSVAVSFMEQGGMQGVYLV